MPKGYWIGRVDVSNDEGYKRLCRGQCRASSGNTAAASWCAAASSRVVEGTSRSRNVVIEFPDYATALACYRSPEYQANIKVRAAALRPPIIVIIEGYDGPQP